MYEKVDMGMVCGVWGWWWGLVSVEVDMGMVGGTW